MGPFQLLLGKLLLVKLEVDEAYLCWKVPS